MKVVITGGHGFLGWHTACRLRALRGIEPVRLGRHDLAHPVLFEEAMVGADVVLHLAGVNRAGSGEEVYDGNVALAAAVASAVSAAGRPVRLVYANSIQTDLDSAYGRGKAEASRILRSAVGELGGSVADVLLPNLFGEHGRPHYNSFVATFCHLISRDEVPTLSDDKDVVLLHAQRAAEILLQAMAGDCDERLQPGGEAHRVSEVLDLLREFHELYRHGEIPALDSSFRVDMFNTYRSYTFPQMFPIRPKVHADRRGYLFEAVRAHGGTGQAFLSTTRPGHVRGDHYHLRKVERFVVVKGEAEIALRRLLDDEVVRFRVSGSEPGVVDMPTMWVHSISNVGHDDLVTMFWADQLLDPLNPDQFPERVVSEVHA